MKIKKIYILLISFIIIFVCSGSVLISWYIDNVRISRERREIEGIINIEELYTDNMELINPPEYQNNDYWNFIRMPFINVDLTELQKINSDTVGFISVSGTNINYPIVQTTNNEYYSNHSFRKKRNNAGWIFMDYRNNALDFDRNTIFYGHSRFDGTMFGSLKNVLTTNWLNDRNNHIVRLSTINENTLWQIFSVYTIPVENYYLNIDFITDEEYNTWLQTMLNRSIHDFNTTLDINDRVITLSTCADTNNKQRIVVHAKLLKRTI